MRASDLQQLLKGAALRSGKSFKVLLNDAVRLALKPAPVAPRAAPEWPAFDMGPPLVGLTKAMALVHERHDQPNPWGPCVQSQHGGAASKL